MSATVCLSAAHRALLADEFLELCGPQLRAVVHRVTVDERGAIRIDVTTPCWAAVLNRECATRFCDVLNTVGSCPGMISGVYFYGPGAAGR